MTVGQSHEVSIGGVEYRVKFGTSSVFEHGYQAPFIERQSVSASRSEGDYSGDLVFTQSAWVAGEGVKTMRTGAESNYWYSETMDVSGASAGLQLLKDSTDITDGVATLGTDLAIGSTTILSLVPGAGGVQLIYKKYTSPGHWTNYAWLYDGSTWGTNTSGRNDETLNDSVPLFGYIFNAFSGGIARVTTSNAFTANWGSDVATAIGTDGTTLYYATRAGSSNGYYSYYWSIAPLGGGGAGSAESVACIGETVAMTGHAGTVYAVTFDTPSDSSYLYRFDGSNFVLWKVLPDGFIAQSMKSDGSTLYMGGQEKGAEGNYRGRIYYLTGTASTESLGELLTFGERDGVSEYDVLQMTVHGKSLYFPWNYYGGVGRYDTANSGFSRSYTGGDMASSVQYILPTTYSGDIYIAAHDTETRAVYKTSSTVYSATGELQGSYADFGLPISQKLYTKVVIVTPTPFSSYAGADVAVSYSTDGDTSTWTSLSASLAGETADTDSSTGFYKYTLTMPSNGLKAHSVAVKLVLTRSTATTETPQISHVTTVAKPLLNTPGTTSPLDTWRFNVIIAENCRTMTGAIEARQNDAKMLNLRTLFEAQEPTALITMAEPTTTHQVLIKNLSEVSPSKARNNSYEATVNVECVKV